MKRGLDMKYQFKKMTFSDAKEIASWKYKGYLKDIYMEPYFKNYNKNSKELKGPGNCDGYAVYSGYDLVGLFEYYHKDNIIEIGLALKPELAGKGLSKEFILEGIKFGIETFDYQGEFIQLSVDIRNEEAYYAYMKVGFKEVAKDGEEIIMHYPTKLVKF